MKNENAVFIMFTVLFVVVLVSVVVLIGTFIINFNKKTRFIVKKMDFAESHDEYIQLRKRLYCHYLCLIPFVNKRNVLNLYKLIFYKPKHQSVQKRTDGIWHILAPSLIGLCLCTVCLCGASWAWFSATQTSSVTTITAATYTVDVTAAIGEMPVEVTSNNNTHTIVIEKNKSYDVTVITNGTANTGFCTVTLGDKTYHTPQIVNGTDFKFKVNTDQDGILTITSQWGTCATGSDDIIASNGQIPFSSVGEPYNTRPDNTAIVVLQPSADTPQVSTSQPDDTTESGDTVQDEENATTPNVEATQPETTLPSDDAEPTVSEPTSSRNDAETTKSENTTE